MAESQLQRKTWQEKYATSMKMLLPFRLGKEKNKKNLQDENIGCISYLSLHWMNGHMWKASRNQLNINQVKDIRKRNGVEINMQKLKPMWTDEVKRNGRNNASLFRTISKFNKLRLAFASIFITLMAITNYVGPTWVLNKMLRCLDDPNVPKSQGVIWAAVFSATQLARHFMFNAYWVTAAYAGVKVTAALQGMMYAKLCEFKTSSEVNLAEVVSYFSTDFERIYQMVQTMCLLVPPSLITVTHLVFCYLLLGPWTLLGNTVMLLYAPFMVYVTKTASKYRRAASAFGDKRIGFMNQLLNNVKFIKMMAWENIFFDNVKESRDREAKSLTKAIFLQSISWSTVVIAGNLALALTTTGYLLTGGNLDTIQILNLMSAYAALATPLGTVVIAVKALSEGLISCRRIQEFLTPNDDDLQATDSYQTIEDPIKITNLTVSWNTSDKPGDDNNHNQNLTSHENSITGITNMTLQETELSELQCVLQGINITAQRGQLIGICGPVGCGKSTLLSSICGSTKLLCGKVYANGSISLVTQKAWIFTGTVKQNILFGLPLDAEWYDKVIDACCLQTDFQLMVCGDETEIGERGANLSGGQKQRINLARALYSGSDIHLLDDPLSAVDAKVARHIFQHCIQRHLQSKTVFLVTHATKFLAKCDQIVVLDKGRMHEQGTHNDLIANNKHYAQMCKQITESKNPDEQNGIIVSPTHKANDNSNSDGKMIKAEIDNISTITVTTLLYFFKQCGGYLVSLLLMFSIVLFAAMPVFNNVWFKIWLTSDEHSITIETDIINNYQPQFYPYFAVYVGSMAGIIILALIKGALLQMTILTGSTYLHMQMFWKVVRSPMAFFDSTPVGRIVNRFSRDMDELDVHIPSIGEYVSQTLLIVTLQAIVVCVLYPWFAIALVIIIVIFIVFDKLFTSAVQETKRLDNLLKPPIISHLITTTQGLEVIRCYKKQEYFADMFKDVVEKHLSPYLQYELSSKWFSFRVDIIGWVAITVLAMMIMLTKSSMSTLNGGLSLVLIVQACIILSVAMRFKSELEAKLMSIQRVCDYSIRLVEEAPAIIKDNRPPPQWPSEGNIEFRNVYMKYRPETPLVLKGLNVFIKGGEKVGVIGRTGAGKTSIVATLMRLVEVHDGAILIDDVDISKIGLEDLRSSIAVIPQDPVLFDGTVRWNLDPNLKYADDEMWDALEKSYLINKIKKEKNGLYTSFTADGGMFSVGEKQLFCLARALLIKSKILLLDEATANVDLETDKLIQKSIRNSFRNCTVVTIAHRLNTIVDYDKVVIMDAGKVIEYDTPSNLMATDSQFRSMMNAQ